MENRFDPDDRLGSRLRERRRQLGLSQAELARAADEAAKEALLSERDFVRTEDLITQRDARRDMRDVFKGNA